MLAWLVSVNPCSAIVQVQGLAAEYVFRPVHIRIGKGEQLNACHKVEQVVQVMQEQQKTASLLKLLAMLRRDGGGKSDGDKVLIFVNRKAMCGAYHCCCHSICLSRSV